MPKSYIGSVRSCDSPIKTADVLDGFGLNNQVVLLLFSARSNPFLPIRFLKIS